VIYDRPALSEADKATRIRVARAMLFRFWVERP
jgi:hypothetical protein